MECFTTKSRGFESENSFLNLYSVHTGRILSPVTRDHVLPSKMRNEIKL